MAKRSSRPDKGVWFPLSLGALVVVAVPSAVLLALSLLGLENSANGWLQRTFGLTYKNPLPAWAAIALLLVPVALVLLYFLKLRRKALIVPTTLLWRKSIEDLRVNSLFQWLRDNVLLLVQLAVVLLLIYSALAFQVHGTAAAGGRAYILLIDSSASMACTDVAPSRLEAARAAALREIDARPDGDAGMVIEFNSRAITLQPYTRDKGALRAAVRRIAQTNRPTRLDEALALADSLANPPDAAANRSLRPEGEDPA
ncbi:MAG: VWA domain-containing protein [Gemmataceae bacterium]|nr:VWA domain-containing protein [Gemmataceae bacterium]